VFTLLLGHAAQPRCIPVLPVSMFGPPEIAFLRSCIVFEIPGCPADVVL